MSVVVQKMKAENLKTLIERKGKSYVGTITDEHAAAYDQMEFAYTAFIDGKIMLCAGVTKYWEGRGEAWAVFHPDCKKHFFTLHNMVKRFLEICPLRRIEAAVDVNFEPGHRWVKSLGFKLEAPVASGYLPDGRDAALYARRNHG